LAVRSSVLPSLTTIRQTIRHSITGIMLVVVAGDSMDMDKRGCLIGRMLPLRNPRCRESNNYVFE